MLEGMTSSSRIQRAKNSLSRFKKVFTPPLRQALLSSAILGIVSILIVGFISNKALMYAIDADMANAFLGTVAQVTAGIVAIVFTVSTLAVTIVSDRYSAQLTAKFLYDPLTVSTFLLLLLCGSVAVVSIGVSYPMYQLGFLAMVFAFVFCLAMLLFYLAHTLSFLKPEGLADNLVEEGTQALLNRDYEKLERIITSLGDIILKAFDRGEDAVAKLYFQSLAQLQKKWLEQDQPVEVRDEVYAPFSFGRRSPVFNQYKRVLRTISTRGDEDLSETINALASESILNVIEQSENIETLKGLLSQYNDLVALVVKNKSPARFGYLRSFRRMILEELDYRRRTHIEKYVSISKFVEVNRIIIEHADQELWGHTLSFFCSGHQSVNDLAQSIRHNVSMLHSDMSRTDYDWFMGWRLHLDRILAPHMSAPTHTMLKGLLVGLEQKLPDDVNAKNQLGVLIRYSYELYVSQHLIYAFFQIGFEAFKEKRYDYLEQLWKTQHGHPDLERVPSDIAFNIIMIYQYVSLPMLIAHRPNEIFLFKQYCFLYLSYSLQKCQQSEWVPSIPLFSEDQLNKNDEIGNILKKELENIYHLLTKLPHVIRELLPAYEHLVPDAATFDGIFEDEAAIAFEKAYKWLNNLPFMNKWSETADEIISHLPIDSAKQAQVKQAIEHGYLASTKLHLVTNVVSEQPRQYDTGETYVPEPQEVFVRDHINRQDLTLLGPERFEGHLGFRLSNQEEKLLSIPSPK